VRGQAEAVRELNNLLDGMTAKIYRILSHFLDVNNGITLGEVKGLLGNTTEKGFVE
jgi:hypothetical protein